MRRMLLRVATALLTFCLGVAVTVVSSVKPTETTSEPTLVLTFSPPETQCFPGRSLEITAINEEAFFPPKVLTQDQPGNQFRDEWYSKHLRAMKEGPLYLPDEWVESYRFLWLRTFHHPVAVRIWKIGTVGFISVKELNGAGGYEPGTLIFKHERQLAFDEWSKFMRLLDDSCYWQLPTRNDNIGGFDGAQWIFEAVKEGRYHVVDRWTPQSGSYRELCLYVLELSRLKVDSRVLY